MATWTSPSSAAAATRWIATLVGPKAVHMWLASWPSRRAASSAAVRNVRVVIASLARAAAMDPAKKRVPYMTDGSRDSSCLQGLAGNLFVLLA